MPESPDLAVVGVAQLPLGPRGFRGPKHATPRHTPRHATRHATPPARAHKKKQPVHRRAAESSAALNPTLAAPRSACSSRAAEIEMVLELELELELGWHRHHLRRRHLRGRYRRWRGCQCAIDSRRPSDRSGPPASRVHNAREEAAAKRRSGRRSSGNGRQQRQRRRRRRRDRPKREREIARQAVDRQQLYII